MGLKFFGKSNKDKKKINEIHKSFFTQEGKYKQLDTNLEQILHEMEKLAKYGNSKNIILEGKVKGEIKELLLYIKKNKKYLKEFIHTIKNIYKKLQNIQFFLPEGKDKVFVEEQTNNLKKYINLKEYKKDELPGIMKTIDFITEEIKIRNKKNLKSNESFITAIVNIYRLLNNIKNSDDLIKKILNNSTILKNSIEWFNIKNNIISTFEDCFNAINKSIENDLIDPEIYTNDEYIKVIENFINIIPKEKQEIFNKCLETINNKKIKYYEDLELEVFDVDENYNESHSSSPKSEKTDSKQVEQKISTNSSIPESNVLTCSKNKMEIKIKFKDSDSKKKFKEEFSKLKSEGKRNCLNTMLLQYKNSSLESKILNITYDGETYKGEGNIWNKNNYSNTKLKQTQNSNSR